MFLLARGILFLCLFPSHTFLICKVITDEMMSMTNRNNLSASFGFLILRVVVGVTFFMHGWQKLNEWTIAGTTASFIKMGIPAPEFMAPAITWLELIGGILLILGVATRLLGLLFAANMVGTIALVHGSAGFYAANGGYEFALLLGGAALALIFTGAGIFAIDSIFTRRKAARA